MYIHSTSKIHTPNTYTISAVSFFPHQCHHVLLPQIPIPPIIQHIQPPFHYTYTRIHGSFERSFRSRTGDTKRHEVERTVVDREIKEGELWSCSDAVVFPSENGVQSLLHFVLALLLAEKHSAGLVLCNLCDKAYENNCFIEAYTLELTDPEIDGCCTPIAYEK